MEMTPYSIEIYQGEIRSGKTLSMVAETYEDYCHNPKLKIYSNIWLNRKYFKNYEHINLVMMEDWHKKSIELQNCTILLDEMHQFLDSRNFMHKKQKHFTHLLGMLGKRNVTLRGTTHFFDMLDYRLRQYCERRIYITKGLLFGRKWKPILNNNRILSDEENELLCIKAESVIRKLINYDFYYVLDRCDYVLAKKYFNLYDTRELVAEQRYKDEQEQDVKIKD